MPEDDRCHETEAHILQGSQQPRLCYPLISPEVCAPALGLTHAYRYGILFIYLVFTDHFLGIYNRAEETKHTHIKQFIILVQISLRVLKKTQ